jgi:DNA-binding GntR family transcriptional regulator
MPLLMNSINSLHQVSARFLFATWKELAWRPRSDEEHREILESIRDRKLDRATDALQRHVLSAGKALAKRLQGT